jgi:hypothetical protein
MFFFVLKTALVCRALPRVLELQKHHPRYFGAGAAQQPHRTAACQVSHPAGWASMFNVLKLNHRICRLRDSAYVSKAEWDGLRRVEAGGPPGQAAPLLHSILAAVGLSDCVAGWFYSINTSPFLLCFFACVQGRF